jgi:tetratricopeptide (TPR) repeat protein
MVARAARLAMFLVPFAHAAGAVDDSPRSGTLHSVTTHSVTTHSVTTIGAPNQYLASGSVALEAGRYEEGLRLSLAGLEEVASFRDQAAGHANVCAGYAALKRWHEALPHCNRSLELDRSNWRAFNNRAAVYVGLGLLELAMSDVNAGLELAPDSRTLHKSLEVVKEHRDADRRAHRRQSVRT